MMDADQLYEEMKAALRYFGLEFFEKDKMTIRTTVDEIIFSYGERHITVKVNP